MPYTGVGALFESIVANTQLWSDESKDASGKHSRVRATLNKAYYGIDSETANSLLVGSYGKNTAIRPPSDIDILFQLPFSVFERYRNRTGNIQSQLLQEVKGILQQRFPTTEIKADGQIILVPFTSYLVEVLPAFKLTTNQYWHADTNNGGKWRTTDPIAEVNALEASNKETRDKTIHLIKMAKAWKRIRNVSVKSLVLELTAPTFLSTWQHKDKTFLYYDFMVRDFFDYLMKQQNRHLTLPGTGDFVYTGDAWAAQARFASSAAQRATDLGQEDKIQAAKEEWRNIFGSYVPF
jgi:hypothetical protein